MPPTRSVFYGFGAWVSQQLGPTRCTWWAQDPATLNPPFDPTKTVDTDLAKNPNAAKTAGLPIDQIVVDDAPPHGGLTKIGPTFPAGSMLNSVWMEQTKYDALKGFKPPRVPADIEAREYELKTVWYWSGALANRRFWGFHAQITSENGQNALVSIWPAGRSLERGIQPAGTWWLNLSQVAHPIEAGFTAIGVGLNPKLGALFLDAPTAQNLSLGGPKLPKSSGREALPRAAR